MIQPIKKEQLPICLEIMKQGYEDTAVKFGMTEVNCPYRGRTRLPYSILEKEYNDGCLMYVYRYNDEIVGFLSLFMKEQKMYLNDIVVLPSHQNHGIGSEFMRFAKEKSGELNCGKMVLGMIYDNIPLRNWYEKEGFHTVQLINYEKINYTVGIMEMLLNRDK